jgi:hypothetical protein
MLQTFHVRPVGAVDDAVGPHALDDFRDPVLQGRASWWPPHGLPVQNV